MEQCIAITKLRRSNLWLFFPVFHLFFNVLFPTAHIESRVQAEAPAPAVGPQKRVSTARAERHNCTTVTHMRDNDYSDSAVY